MDPGGDFDAALAAAQQGADWAVAVLYRELHPRLLRYLWAREPRVAEDLESEVWLAVAARIREFRGDESAFRGWVFSIARRRLADFRRTAARRATNPAPVERLDRWGPDDTEAEAIEHLSAEQAAKFVTKVLSQDQAEVMLLRVLGGLDVEQVAQILGKRAGTIRVLQHRALRRLSEVLEARPVTQ
jgi:RNA polymerase sigma-70 factor (ECF subfamily)